MVSWEIDKQSEKETTEGVHFIWISLAVSLAELKAKSWVHSKSDWMVENLGGFIVGWMIGRCDI